MRRPDDPGRSRHAKSRCDIRVETVSPPPRCQRRRHRRVGRRFHTWLVSASAFVLTGCGGLARSPPAADPMDGRAVYERDCLACHMASGRGVPGMTPTLIASPWVTGGVDALIGYVLTGGFGPVSLMGRFDYLTDAEMAAVLNYIRREYGEGAAPVTAAQVAAVRAQIERG